MQLGSRWESTPSPPQARNRLGSRPWLSWTGTATVVLALVTLVLGVWAFVFPVSFFEVIAPFEPYNRHFIHDAGALQVGVAVALLLSVKWLPGTVVGLGGFVAFSALHVVSHVLDRDIGGRPERDIPFLVALAVVGLVALVGAYANRGHPDSQGDRT